MQQTTWQVPNMWEDGDVWVLGGGASLLTTFEIPNAVVNEVHSHTHGIETYSPYLAALHDKHIIGVNVAYKFGSWVDICFFGDNHFFLEHRAALSNFKKLVVTCSQNVGNKNVSWVKYLSSEKKQGNNTASQRYGISTNAKQVCWNNSSGAAAISVAAWAGAKRIILVGFDMKCSIDNQQHFHNEYRSVSANERMSQIQFKAHLQPWEIIKSDADNMGIEILNTSLNSAIKEIPKVHIKELV